jgi:hypothetical protein
MRISALIAIRFTLLLLRSFNVGVGRMTKGEYILEEDTCDECGRKVVSLHIAAREGRKGRQISSTPFCRCSFKDGEVKDD